MNRLCGKNRIEGIFVAVLFLLCVIAVVLIHTGRKDDVSTSPSSTYMIVYPDSVEEEKIDGYAGIQHKYTLTIPEYIDKGTYLTFYLRHAFVSCVLEDGSYIMRVSEPDSPHIGHTNGHYWVMVPSSPSFAGRKMYITVTPVYKSSADEVPTFYYTDPNTLLSRIILPRDQLVLLLSITAIAAGLFLTIMSITPDLSDNYRYKAFYMGTATIFAGIWKLCSLPAFIFTINFMGLEKEMWYTATLSYVLTLVLYLRLQISIRSGKRSRITDLCFYTGVISAFLIVVLQLTNLLDMHETLVIYGFIMAALHFVSLFYEKPDIRDLIWGIPFFITLGLDFLLLLRQGTLHGAPFFLMWILLNLFIRGIGFLRDDIKLERQLGIKEAELRESRMQALINEIRPHFIHNTLTSIYILCREDPPRAQRVVSDFSAYLHANFSAISATDPIPFTRELEHTKSYVAIESMLHEGKLNVEYDIGYTAFRLPPLTLQPIVENAVKYSVGKGQAYGHIIIRTKASYESAVIIIEDNGEGFVKNINTDEDRDKIHIGLNNVRERLLMMCNGTLDIESKDGTGTIVTIAIPLHGHPDGPIT